MAQGVYTVAVALLFAGMLVVLILVAVSLPGQPDELGLVAVLAITMASVIVASLVTALLYRLVAGEHLANSSAEIFWASIKRYGFIASPIATGYGLSQIIERVAEIVSAS